MEPPKKNGTWKLGKTSSKMHPGIVVFYLFGATIMCMIIATIIIVTIIIILLIIMIIYYYLIYIHVYHDSI